MEWGEAHMQRGSKSGWIAVIWTTVWGTLYNLGNGEVNSTLDSRIIQFALKFNF
jgi:hypothetical protein